MSMRVTTSAFTQNFMAEINNSLNQQLSEQSEIASGVAFTQPSDNPVGFANLKFQETAISQTNNYLSSTSEASNEATFNANAMSNLQTVMNQASTLAQEGLNGALGASGLTALGTEMSSLVTQVQSIANRSNNGYYAFGGTQNAAPVSSTSPPSYNTAGLTDNVLKTIQIDPNSDPVNVQIFAGVANTAVSPDANAADATTFATTAVTVPNGSTTGTAMNGFLVQAGATGQAAGTNANSGGVDILGFLRNAAYTLSQGQSLSTDQLDNLIRASNYVSQYVGQTTATEAQFGLNTQSLTSVQQSQQVNISNISSANVATLSTDLNETQLSYQGALDAGAKILGLSLLNYLH